MNLLLKQILLVVGVFIVVLWYQDYEDKKNNKVRKTFYDQYKLPLLISSILGLILSFKELLVDMSGSHVNCMEEITVIIPQKIKPNIPKAISLSELGQHVYTDLPDF